MKAAHLLGVLLVSAAVARAQSGEDEIKSITDRIWGTDGNVIRDSSRPGNPITQVSLGRKPIPPSLLANLAKLKDLKRVNFSYTTFSDNDLKDLAGLEQIDTLDLIGTPVTGVGFRHLAHLKRLETLFLENAKINDAGLKEIAALPGLTYLAIADNPISDRGLVELARSKTLQDLNLQYTAVTDDGLKALLPMQKLRLTIPDAAKTDLGLKHYRAITRNGGELYIGSWNVTDAGLQAIETKGLRMVDLSRTKVTDQVLKKFADAQYLSSLNLRGCAIDGTGLAALAPLAYLKHVDLSSCPLTDDGMEALAKVKSVTELVLDGTPVTGAGLKKLASLPSLESLSLADVPLTDTAIESLSKAQRLKTIHVTRISKEARAKLHEALRNCEIQ